MSDKTYWAIGLDWGTEGKGAPLTLVYSKEEADQIAEFLSLCHAQSVYISEVPLWPCFRSN